MSAPERLWAYPTEKEPRPSKDRKSAPWVKGVFTTYDTSGEHRGPSGKVRYRRDDLPPTDAEVMAHPKVKALVDAADPIANWTIGNMLADDPKVREEYPHLSQAILDLRAALAAIQEDRG